MTNQSPIEAMRAAFENSYWDRIGKNTAYIGLMADAWSRKDLFLLVDNNYYDNAVRGAYEEWQHACKYMNEECVKKCKATADYYKKEYDKLGDRVDYCAAKSAYICAKDIEELLNINHGEFYNNG